MVLLLLYNYISGGVVLLLLYNYISGRVVLLLLYNYISVVVVLLLLYNYISGGVDLLSLCYYSSVGVELLLVSIQVVSSFLFELIILIWAEKWFQMCFMTTSLNATAATITTIKMNIKMHTNIQWNFTLDIFKLKKTQNQTYLKLYVGSQVKMVYVYLVIIFLFK